MLHTQAGKEGWNENALIVLRGLINEPVTRGSESKIMGKLLQSPEDRNYGELLKVTTR
jgi:hypothetical protein